MEKGVTEITDMVFSSENEERIEKEEGESIETIEIGSGEEEEKKKKNSVGIINNFISNLVSPKVEQDSTFPEARNGGDDEDERENGGIGLIDNLVSHLPSSPLPDDAAPATEEASILIHSIVHD